MPRGPIGPPAAVGPHLRRTGLHVYALVVDEGQLLRDSQECLHKSDGETLATEDLAGLLLEVPLSLGEGVLGLAPHVRERSLRDAQTRGQRC